MSKNNKAPLVRKEITELQKLSGLTYQKLLYYLTELSKDSKLGVRQLKVAFEMPKSLVHKLKIGFKKKEKIK